MAIGCGRRLLAPHREIAFLLDADRRLFGLARSCGAGLQQRDLLLGGNGIPIDALAGGEVARGILGLPVRLLNNVPHGMRDIGQARGTCAFIEHGFDAETPRLLGDIRLIDGTQFFDPAGQAIEVDRANPAAFGQHAVEHRDMRVQLRIRRLQRHFANVGVSPAFFVSPLDVDRGRAV